MDEATRQTVEQMIRDAIMEERRRVAAILQDSRMIEGDWGESGRFQPNLRRTLYAIGSRVESGYDPREKTTADE